MDSDKGCACVMVQCGLLHTGKDMLTMCWLVPTLAHEYALDHWDNTRSFLSW
jgi:hypothetical protein